MPRALLLALFALALPLRAQSDEIVARNLAARGGRERLLAVKSQRLRGRIAFGAAGSSALAVEMKRPGKMREELQVAAGAFVRVTDGKAGFALDRSQPKPEPRALSKDELRNLAGGADFDGPLLDYAAKGNRVALVGKEKVLGRDAFKLEVTLKDGRVRTDFIDCASYLEVKWRGTLVVGGKPTEFESIFRDHRQVAGITFPFAIDSGAQQIIVDSVEVNPEIADARFERP